MAKATGGKKKVFRKKEKKNVPVGIVHVAASFNNTMISITDLEGNLIAQSSAGSRGFRGSRKGTPFAAQQAAFEAAKKAHEAGMQQCEVRVKGPGGGRESAIRAIANAGIRVSTIRDTTPIPHNGCRPPKRRRVWGVVECRGADLRDLVPRLVRGNWNWQVDLKDEEQPPGLPTADSNLGDRIWFAIEQPEIPNRNTALVNFSV